MPKPKIFERKKVFHVPSDNVEFDNHPNCIEAIFIRIFHWLSRVFVQWGALHTWNPLVFIPSFVLYQLDIIWSGLDKQYYVKRRAMYGPNFISATSVVMSKFDENATAPDALDSRFLTIPQRRGFFLGSTIMTRDHLPKDRRPGKPDRNVSLLHVSDRGVVKDPQPGELDHDVLRESAMCNFLGGAKLEAVKARAQDDKATALIKEFANKAKGTEDRDQLSPLVEDLLIRYYHYILFDLAPDKVPAELLTDTFYKGLSYVLYIFGPKWLPTCLLRCIVKPRSLDKKLLEVREYYASSPVFDDFVPIPEGPDALTKEGLLELLEMLIGIAALQGTKALALASLTQMPKGHAAKAVAANPQALKSAVLEIARLDAPVTGAHCIAEEPLETTIGNKKLTFPRGTVIFTAMTLANTDEKRFKCPYVFDPDREDLVNNLTSFNSIGERTGDSPRICPGRELAVTCVCQMLRAKIQAEQERSTK